VKHQEGLLARCKEIIMGNKEKMAALTAEKARSETELENTALELNKLRVGAQNNWLTINNDVYKQIMFGGKWVLI